MRRLSAASFVVLLGLLSVASAGPPDCQCKTRCLPTPPPDCLNCPVPCAHRLCLTLFPPAHAQALVAQLHDPVWCERRCAAFRLGCRLHADYCRDPAVLEALIAALQCDPCWRVRFSAATGIRRQNAFTTEALLALYISSKLDPHYEVRVRAAESYDILTVMGPACFKAVTETGEKLVKELRAKKYKPGSENCRVLLGQVCAGCGVAPLTTPQVQAQPPRPTELPERPPEKLDLPGKGSR